MGPSGSGKSTLVHALAGLDVVDSGQVLLGDTDLTTLSERSAPCCAANGSGSSSSLQPRPALTAAENIALPLTLAGKKPDPHWIAELVDMLGLATGSPPAGPALRRPAAAGRRRRGR